MQFAYTCKCILTGRLDFKGRFHACDLNLNSIGLPLQSATRWLWTQISGGSWRIFLYARSSNVSITHGIKHDQSAWHLFQGFWPATAEQSTAAAPAGLQAQLNVLCNKGTLHYAAQACLAPQHPQAEPALLLSGWPEPLTCPWGRDNCHLPSWPCTAVPCQLVYTSDILLSCLCLQSSENINDDFNTNDHDHDSGADILQYQHELQISMKLIVIINHDSDCENDDNSFEHKACMANLLSCQTVCVLEKVRAASHTTDSHKLPLHHVCLLLWLMTGSFESLVCRIQHMQKNAEYAKYWQYICRIIQNKCRTKLHSSSPLITCSEEGWSNADQWWYSSIEKVYWACSLMQIDPVQN